MTDKTRNGTWPWGKKPITENAKLRAERDKLKADLTEALLQSLSDQGQAQDAYEAQKKAEAYVEILRGYMQDIARDYLKNCPDGYNAFAIKKMEEVKDEV